MRTIELSQGQVAIVDDEDYEALSAYPWCAQWAKGTGTFYVVRKTPIGGGKRETFLMHRVVTSAPKGMQVDHINKNTLDNRKENLRVCTTSENQRNRGKFKNNTSGYKGVAWMKDRNKWWAKIKLHQKVKHLGYFTDPVEAARAYDKAALELHGEFAVLNFPVSP